MGYRKFISWSFYKRNDCEEEKKEIVIKVSFLIGIGSIRIRKFVISRKIKKFKCVLFIGIISFKIIKI